MANVGDRGIPSVFRKALDNLVEVSHDIPFFSLESICQLIECSRLSEMTELNILLITFKQLKKCSGTRIRFDSRQAG